MNWDFRTLPQRLFGPDHTQPGYLAARWLFLRALGLIFFSAFYSLFFQIRGLIGPDGILPAGTYLAQVARILGSARFWYAPTVFWWSASDRFLLAVVIVGMIASILLTLNLFTRGMLIVCLVAFLSFISAAQDFASYQSDGMLLEAGFISLFFAPPGWRPRWGSGNPASRASRYMLIWLMFRIYFESGVAKILGHDPEWRDFTAMDQYYQNGPLPTWISWYMHQLPHPFHAATAVLTLALELVLIFGIFLPRRSRIVLFFILTPWQLGVILTSNYAFLNYLVMVLGVLLLDDKFLARFLPRKLQLASTETPSVTVSAPISLEDWRSLVPMGIQAIFLTWIFYATSALLILMMFPSAPLPLGPIRKLEPFRIANEFGLFAVMTRSRYEIEFQGSRDGENWVAYPFRNKPQEVHTAPRIYAPYQPRFDWNLWFASLGGWRQYRWVVQIESRLLSGSPDVLSLFAADPFAGKPPEQVRAVLWEYRFTNLQEKRDQGIWWNRDDLGLYAPTLGRTPEGKISILEFPDSRPESQ